jgi:tetratricopeptide (TPR) repeat protein
MLKDQTGLLMTGSEEAAAHYNRAIGHLLAFQPEVVAQTDAARAADPNCVMARALRAYLGLMSSEYPDAVNAAQFVRGLTWTSDREAAHLSAIGQWIGGDWHGASRTLDQLLSLYPRDILALSVGHQLDFFLGEAGNLRGRITRALPHWDPDHHLYGYLLGMQAFGLEECGQYQAAEKVGRAAIAHHADDVWAIHAVGHTYEMRGLFEEGIGFLDSQSASWTTSNFLKVHTSWHKAIFALEQQDYQAALAICDETLSCDQSLRTALEMADAASLLWRVHLDEVDVGSRWEPLAEAWASKDPTCWYVFNDLHAILAMVGAGRQAEAEAIVARMEASILSLERLVSNALAMASAGLPVAQALSAFGRGDYGQTVSLMAPIRHQLSIFGGSHAQRDVFQRTLLVAARRAGQTAFAKILCQERLEARPTSVWATAQNGLL